MMLFEAMLAGRRMVYTEHREALPDKRQRASMRAAGYVLYLDGKEWKM